MSATSNPTTDQHQWVLTALERFEQPLLRYSQRLLGNLEQARDVVQHAFLKLCNQSPAGLQLGPMPWLFRVCRNRALDLLREASHRNSAAGSADEAEVNRLPSREPNPAASAEQQDLCRALRKLMLSLPNLQREVVELWSEGLGYREIAEIMDQRETYVRVLAHRAIRTLKEHPQVKAWIESTLATS